MRLEPDVRAKLNERAKALGLDAAAYVRMLTYRDLNGPAEACPVPRQASPSFRRPVPSAAPLSAAPEPELDEPELEDLVDENEPRAEEMEIPADPDGGAPALDDVMAGASDLLDQMVALSEQSGRHGPESSGEGRRIQAAHAPRAPRQYQPRFGNRNRRQVMPAYGPGSATRVVGVNDQVAGQNQYGDPHGNVLRDNMQHLGLVGTRSRA